MIRLRRAAAILCGVLLLLAALPQPRAEGIYDEIQLPELGRPGAAALPLYKERELGTEIMQQVRRHLPLHPDVELNHYIGELGARLAAHSEQPGYGFNFFVVDDDQINAFALPGGHIGIHSGLIRESRTESELAGVLAHEIAHVTQRHIARNYARAQNLNLQTAAAVLAAILIGAQDPQAGSAAAMAGIAAPIQQQLRHSREHEREADRVGIRNMAAAGFDPAGMPGFFEQLAHASRFRESPPEYLSTHPLTERRMVEAQDLADRLGGGTVFESGHHAFMRARAEVLAKAGSSTSAVAVMHDRLEQTRDDPTRRAAAIYGVALALSLEAGEHEAALALLDTLEAIDGERLYVLLGRGEVLRNADRPREALTVYDEARSLYPGSGAALYRHAETLISHGEAEEARRILANATRGRQRSPELLRLLADAAHASGREAEGYIALAEHHHSRGELQLALAQLSNAIRVADENRYQRARAEALRERWQQQRD